LISDKARIISMIPMMKTDKHSLWQLSEELLNIYLQFSGKPT